MKINNLKAYCTLILACLGLCLNAQDTIQSKKKNFLEQDKIVPFDDDVKYKLSTSSSSSVKGDNLVKKYTPNIGYALSGKLTGLQVVQGGGTPGNLDNPGLIIRGKQTFSDNTILILVDGIETKWSYLIPEQIESVTLLKDAASLALYGQRGANGVLYIKTKRGTTNEKIKVSLNTRWGIQQAATLPEFVSNGDYAEMYNIAMNNDGKDISNGYFKNQEIVNYFKSQKYPYLYPDVNWYNELLKDQAFAQDYSLSFTGGNDYVKYYTVIGYMNSQGLYANTNGTTNSNYDLKKYNLMTNLDLKLTDWLKSEVNFRAVMLDKRFPNVDENTLWKTLGTFLPYPVKTPSGAWGGTEKYSANPVASVLQSGYKSINERTIDASFKLIADLDKYITGLSIHGQFNFNNNYYMHYDKTRSFAYEELVARPDKIVPGETPDNEMPYDVIQRGSDGTFSHTQNSGTQSNQTIIIAGADYKRKFHNHSFKASLNYYQEVYKTKGNEIPFARQNLLGSFKYNYDNKYLADFVMSYSGSENFISGKRFGFFPAMSLGWIITNEDFFDNNEILQFLKFRASYGLTGNDRTGSTGRFIYEQTYVGGGDYYFGENLSQKVGVYKEGNLANPNATWEKALKLDLGFDVQLFDRLSLAATYFHENRNDIYVSPSSFVPSIIGADIYNINAGKVKNQGVEFETFWSDKIGDFSYNIGGRFSYAKNEIIDMKEPFRPDNESYLYAKGRPINQPFVLEAIGYFKDENDIKTSPTQLFGEVKPGDIKYKDQNDDGFIDDNDRIPVGKPSYPDFYYGVDAGVGYKGVDLSISLHGAGNRTVSLLDNNNVIPFLDNGRKPTPWVMENYWTPEKGDNALFPRLTTEQNNNNYRASTLWQRSGSYLRINNIELGYTIPKNVTRRVFIDNLRVFVNVVNPFTWDKISEINVDPEVMNMFQYPVMKSYNLGLSVQF